MTKRNPIARSLAVPTIEDFLALEEADDPPCRTCGEPYDQYGDGWDGECPSCADRTQAKEDEREDV